MSQSMVHVYLLQATIKKHRMNDLVTLHHSLPASCHFTQSTPWTKKTVPHLFWLHLCFMLTNFKFFLSPQSEMISAHTWNKICHPTLILLPHYRVKCEQVQFCENLHRCTYFLDEDIGVIHYWVWLICTATHSIFVTWHQLNAIWPGLQWFVKNSAGQFICTLHSWIRQTATQRDAKTLFHWICGPQTAQTSIQLTFRCRRPCRHS